MLEALECENKRLRGKLARVESESDGAQSMLRAPGGSWQQSSDGKIRERKQSKTKVKARTVTSNNTSSTAKTNPKQSTRSNITDLWRNLTLCNEVNQVLSVLGVPMSIDVAADSSDSSAQESDGPRRCVVKSGKCGSNKKNSQVKSSHTSLKSSNIMFDGWDRLGLNDAMYNGRLSACEENGVMWPNENLGPCYNNYGKAETKYRQLDMRTLVAGELNIVCDCGYQ